MDGYRLSVINRQYSSGSESLLSSLTQRLKILPFPISPLTTWAMWAAPINQFARTMMKPHFKNDPHPQLAFFSLFIFLQICVYIGFVKELLCSVWISKEKMHKRNLTVVLIFVQQTTSCHLTPSHGIDAIILSNLQFYSQAYHGNSQAI